MSAIASVAPPLGAPTHRRFSSRVGEHILLIPTSQIYDVTVDGNAAAAPELDSLLTGLGKANGASALGEPLSSVIAPAPQSISLNVSSSCNLGCSYCYASQGNFSGAQTRAMTWETAHRAVSALLEQASPTAPITVGFLGGEPLVNRSVIHRVVAFAASVGAQRHLDIRFSITTNGTLLTADDIELFRQHRFAVTVSIDGDQEAHDRSRPLASGRAGSYQKTLTAVCPLLRSPGKAQVAARATMTRENRDVGRTFTSITEAGFPEVGFSPLRHSPAATAAFGEDDWAEYLGALTSVARGEFDRALWGMPIRLSNFAIALKQLHRGSCSPYPCGAGGGYFSVSADGEWYTCHRSIGNPDFHVGRDSKLEADKRKQFLVAHHVHSQTDCSTCWARYLCSGSCHQESKSRSRASCDFIRAWLDFCLRAYCELSTGNPAYFRCQPHTQ